VSPDEAAHAGGINVQSPEERDRPSERDAGDKLATSLAMMHATLESTTDAILVTDEANYVREFNEKYVRFWGIPPHMMVSGHVTDLWNYINPQLKDPAGYLARVNEIVASSVPETFDTTMTIHLIAWSNFWSRRETARGEVSARFVIGRSSICTERRRRTIAQY
jgi:PAS domain-containing protein